MGTDTYTRARTRAVYRKTVDELYQLLALMAGRWPTPPEVNYPSPAVGLVHHWIETAQLDRDLDDYAVKYASRPAVPTKSESFEGIIRERLRGARSAKLCCG